MGIGFIRAAALGLVGALAATAAVAQPAAPAHSLLGVDCAAPPLWHCPDRNCEDAVVTQAGPSVELKTRRPFFLDCPSDYRPGEKVNILLSLHGAGSYANWQRNYFPAMDVKDKYRLVIITPSTPTRVWSEADDAYLENLVDLVVGAVGKENVDHFILAGHSQGGLTSSRIVCNDYFKDKVDVRVSLSGGRVGEVTPAGKGFGAGGPPVYLSGKPYAPPPPFRLPRAPAGPPGGACDYSFIFSNGENESIPAPTSPLADKYHCAARVELADVIDPKAGYVWDSSRQDPGTDGWGHYPKSGRALVYQFPNCEGGRVVADVVRVAKGHTEGYEPNITDAIIGLALSAKGGKIAEGSWTPPPAPPPQRFPF
ncbi:MAG TPA: alpha/beta hydrolase [Caulobacteraceae bacterium]|jgi:hypothetical protein